MARVEFITKDGRQVSFQATGKRARGEKRPLTEHNRFMSKRISYWLGQGMDNITAFSEATKEWNMASKGLIRDPIPKVNLDKLIGAVKQKPKAQAKKQTKKQAKSRSQRAAAGLIPDVAPKVNLDSLIKAATEPQAPKARDILAQRRRRKSDEAKRKAEVAQGRRKRAAARAQKRKHAA